MVKQQTQTSSQKLWKRNTDDEVFAARLLWSDITGFAVTKHTVTEAVKATPRIEVLDALKEIDAQHQCSSTAVGLVETRSGIELLGQRDSLEEHTTGLRVAAPSH